MLVLIAALVLFAVLALMICGYALWKGGRWERAAGASMLVAIVASNVAGVLGPHWSGPDYGLLAVNSAFFVVLVVIAHHSTRFWPLWAAASQLVGTLTHIVVILEKSVLAQAYETAQPFWGFPILVAIAVGTRSHQVAKR